MVTVVTKSARNAPTTRAVLRLLEVLRSHKNLPTVDLCALVFERLESWRGRTPRHDDVTMVALKVTGTGGAR